MVVATLTSFITIAVLDNIFPSGFFIKGTEPTYEQRK